MTGSPPIEADLERYVQSAAMPCPYARLPTAYVHLRDDVASPATRRQVRDALRTFWSDERTRILAVVPHREPRDHDEARGQAYWLRSQLHYLDLEAKNKVGDNAEAVEAKLRKLYAGWIADTPSFVGPRIIVGTADIMMTALNPLYDPEHSRYAPRTVFPIIRSRDLLAIHERHPEVAFTISRHAKCKIILSLLGNRDGISIDQMTEEFGHWLDALRYYQNFVVTTYTDSFRLDPRTIPHVAENRKRTEECMQSEEFKASLIAFRVMVANRPEVPTLRRILAQNPDVTVFDIARVLYGDVAGMYVPPPERQHAVAESSGGEPTAAGRTT